VVEGKGKAIGMEEQAAQSLLSLHTPKRRICETPSPVDAETGTDMDKVISEGDTEMLNIVGSYPGKTLESRPSPDDDKIDEDQAGSNPGKSHVALAGPNPEPMHDDFRVPSSSSKQRFVPYFEQPVEDVPIPDDVNILDSDDTDTSHLPKIKTRPNWLKPIQEKDRQETSEPDWIIPQIDLPEAENNWADALAKSYKDPEENKLLSKTGDVGLFIKLFCKRIGKKKLCKSDSEVDLVNPEGHRLLPDVSKPLPLGGPPGQAENNWADALAKSYKDPEENKLLSKTGDVGLFIKWFCKRIGKKKLCKSDSEEFTTFSNILFNTDYEFDSSDDQSCSDEDVLEKNFPNPLFEEEIIPIKIDQHHDNDKSTHDSSLIISSKIDSLLDEFAGELILLKSIPPRINETNCHPENEIHFSKRLLYDNSSPRPPEEFVSENSNVDIESFSPSPIPVEDNGNTGILNIRMMGDISDQKVPIPNLTITHISNHDKSPDLLSHRSLENFQLSAKCPIMIHEKNIPILDVPLFYFYPP
nr:hypothetical protein [Tanacetum cinerariifolium]